MDDRVHVERDWFDQYRFHLVQSIEQVKKLVDICIERKICSLDFETTGVDTRVYPDDYFEDGVTTRHGIRTIDRIVGACLSFDGENGYYLPLSHEPEDSGNLPWEPVWDELTRLVENCRIIFHNQKFDAEISYPLTNKEYWDIDEYEDTFLMSKVINPLKIVPHDLKGLTKINFGIDMVELDELFTEEKKEQLKKQKRRYNFALLHPREGLEYGCSDGIFTYKLYFLLQEQLRDSDPEIYRLEKAFCNVVRKMERNRIHLDLVQVRKLYEEGKLALLEVGDAVREVIESKTGNTGKWLTLNVGSPPQLSQAFFTDQEGLKLKPVVPDDFEDDGSTSQYSTKDEILKELHKKYGPKFSIKRKGKQKEESIFELILEYRHYDKMKGSYIEPLFLSHDKNGDVRPSFNQMGTDTARLSGKADKIENGYSGVNFQGIPRDSDDDKPELFKQIRTCIAPRPGWMMVKIDYSGEELRVVTNMSGDPVWTESFLHGDGDVHSITGRTLYGKSSISKDERTRAKRCNFAFIYGGGAGAIMGNVGCSMEDAQRHMNNLRNDVPVLMGYVDHQKRFAKKYKYILTAFGRRIPIPTIDSPIRGIRAKAERCAINYTIQATSADIIKLAMCFVDKQIRKHGWEDRVKYVMTVHDEIVFEIRPEYLMEIVPKLHEWMVLPGGIPKAHGRDWRVPLDTEPGIDIHWRARYDYFLMVKGSKADPKYINDKGEYTGKLKPTQYYHDGRIYQKIPDFLADYIRREDGSEAEVELSEPEPPPPESPPQESSPEPSLSPEPDLSLESEPDLDFSASTFEPEPESEPPSKPIVSSPNNGGNGNGKPGDVYRWTIMASLNKNSMKKLHAICILAEGDTILRILNREGKVILPDSKGIMINPQKFQLLASLFGLG